MYSTFGLLLFFLPSPSLSTLSPLPSSLPLFLLRHLSILSYSVTSVSSNSSHTRLLCSRQCSSSFLIGQEVRQDEEEKDVEKGKERTNKDIGFFLLLSRSVFRSSPISLFFFLFFDIFFFCLPSLPPLFLLIFKYILRKQSKLKVEAARNW